MKVNKQGFTLVELLVVLLIIAILASIATPLYLQNAQRARASEAVATMSLIRQAQRDFKLSHGTYFDIDEITTQAVGAGNIQRALPASSSSTDGTPSPDPSGIGSGVGVVQYFSNASYYVDADTTPGNIIATQAGLFASPGPVDFIISAKGTNSFPCAGAVDANAGQSCAVKAAQVTGFELMMDNSGRTFVCYGTCGTASNWSTY